MALNRDTPTRGMGSRQDTLCEDGPLTSNTGGPSVELTMQSRLAPPGGPGLSPCMALTLPGGTALPTSVCAHAPVVLECQRCAFHPVEAQSIEQ